jgi:hypothetical protein
VAARSRYPGTVGTAGGDLCQWRPVRCAAGYERASDIASASGLMARTAVTSTEDGPHGGRLYADGPADCRADIRIERRTDGRTIRPAG